MSLTLSCETQAEFRDIVENEALLGSCTLADVKGFKVAAYSLEDRRLVKEKTVLFLADELETTKSFGHGCFHKAYRGVDVEGFLWVFKKPLRETELNQIAPDFLKQMLAFELSAEFTKTQCSTFLDGNVFLLFNKPYIATVTLQYKSGDERPLKGAFFEMESFMHGQFQYFNRPDGDLNLSTGALAPHRLPQAFSKWTAEVTNNRVLVCDVQGCKMHPGGYWCTDPIVFTDNGDFGHVDFGSEGIQTFLKCVDKAMSESIGLEILVSTLPKPTETQKNALIGRANAIIELKDKAGLPEQIKHILKDLKDQADRKVLEDERKRERILFDWKRAYLGDERKRKAQKNQVIVSWIVSVLGAVATCCR